MYILTGDRTTILKTQKLQSQSNSPLDHEKSILISGRFVHDLQKNLQRGKKKAEAIFTPIFLYIIPEAIYYRWIIKTQYTINYTILYFSKIDFSVCILYSSSFQSIKSRFFLHQNQRI